MIMKLHSEFRKLNVAIEQVPIKLSPSQENKWKYKEITIWKIWLIYEAAYDEVFQPKRKIEIRKNYSERTPPPRCFLRKMRSAILKIK